MSTLYHLYEGGQTSRGDVVKMDVVGWEYAVLESVGKMLRATRPYVWLQQNISIMQRSSNDASRINLLAVPIERGQDFKTRVRPAMRSLSGATGA